MLRLATLRTPVPDDPRHSRRGGYGKGVLLVGALLLMAGCGGTSSPTGAPAGNSSGSPSGPSSSSGPNPNAPEVNAAGDIPDNQVYVPYRMPTGGFTVSVPQGWARSTDAGATVFTDKFNGVRLDSRTVATPPDPASAKAQEVPTLQSSTHGFVLGSITTVRRSAGDAVVISYQAQSASDPVTGKTVTDDVVRYDFWRSGTEVVLTLSGPKGADNVDPWRTITESFRWQ